MRQLSEVKTGAMKVMQSRGLGGWCFRRVLLCANKMGLYDVCTIRIFSQSGFTRFYHILPYCTMFCLLGFFLPLNQGWYWLLSLNHSCADARQWHHGPTPFRCRWRCRVCFLGWQVLGDDFISVPSGTSMLPRGFAEFFYACIGPLHDNLFLNNW